MKTGIFFMRYFWKRFKSLFTLFPSRSSKRINYPLARKEYIKSGKWRRQVMLDEHEYASYHLN
jgi:hypothetical protein